MQQSSVIGDSVCVVGAGLSGITAAIQLQKKGYRVKIIEREAQIGGKCVTQQIQYAGQTYNIDLGAVVVAINFQHLLGFAREINARITRPTPYKLIWPDDEIQSLRDFYFPKGTRKKLLNQFFSYFSHVRHFYRHHITKTGYSKAIPVHYQVSFAQFCREHDLEDLLHWFDLPITVWGYKNPQVLPAWYVMGELDPWALFGLLMTILSGRSQFVKTFKDGHGTLLEKLATHHQLDIELNKKVEFIARNSAGILIESEDGQEFFDYVVLSNPEMVDSISNPSIFEFEFLDQIQYAPYATVLCRTKDIPNAKLIVGSNLKWQRGIRMIATPHKDIPYVVCYLSIDQTTTKESVEATVKRELKLLGIECIQVVESQMWKNYFPHFSSFSGYESLVHAQGQNRTLYIGSINQFEYSEISVATTKNLIDQHFPDLKEQTKESFGRLKSLWYWFG
ncbi:MAG: FAD-dependent oxidoreductase [Bacteroidota bacterium]